ncbi:MAG: hypothetical protein C5B54_11505 [Acidobacteria bacterium]|nr:MAG: hypothetical protein C5B54_11505 [Acidobacteriota bacterium]
MAVRCSAVFLSILLSAVFLAFDQPVEGSPISPQDHRTYWFYSACLVGILLAAWIAFRLRDRQMKIREQKLAELVEERTRNLMEIQQKLEQVNQNLEDTNRTLERRVQEGIDALRQAEQMAAYGRLVAGVAHEVRHPVFAIQASAYVLNEKLKDREDLQAQLKTIDRETRRMAALMDDLLEFGRPPTLLLSATDPVQMLNEVVDIFRTTHDSDSIQISIQPADQVPKVTMDKNRMQQVFLNLMGNVQRHAKGATEVQVSVEPVLIVAGERKPSWVSFRVQDNGPGIPASQLDQIFEPFYTTGKGTGLGLSIAQRIIADHGGKIDVDSMPGKGTKFTILIPTEGPSKKSG